MSLLKTIEEDLTKRMNEASIPIEKVTLLESKRKDLGDYQLNDAMSLAKILHKSPMLIAEDMKKVLEESNYFSKVEIAAVGFLNVTLKDELLVEFVNDYYNSDSKDVDKLVNKKIFLDYGGANIAKTLHVGHLRSANIGEALRTCLSKVELTTTTPPKFNLQALPLGKYSDFKITHRSSDPNIPVTSIDFDFSDPLSLTWTKFIDKKGYSRTLDLSNPENNSVQIFPELAKFTAVTNELIQNQSLNSPVFNRLLLGDASSNWSSITQTTTKRR